MSPPSLKELGLVFLRLGATAFGGPAAHIALMEDEFVQRRGWLTRIEFLDLLGAANVIPGPTSTEMAIHIGYKHRGFPGMAIAGASFILPSALLASLLAAVYLRMGHVTLWTGALYGIKPVVIAIIAQALWRLGSSVLISWQAVTLAVIACVLRLQGVNELIVLFGGGVAIFLLGSRARRHMKPSSAAAVGLAIQSASGVGAATVSTGAGLAAVTVSVVVPSLAKLFLTFLKIGSVLFGSGYVLLAFLRADFVERNQWVTEQQLLDAVAVGQVTPGPVSTTATFLGYLLAGPWGAVAATTGMFLPAFFFVWVTAPWIARLRSSPTASRFLDGLNVASLALMATVTLQLAQGAVRDIPSTILLLASGALLFRGRMSAAWLTLGGAIIGVAFAMATQH